MIRGSRLRPYEDDTTLESTAWIFKGGKNKYDSQSKNNNYICQKYANFVVEKCVSPNNTRELWEKNIKTKKKNPRENQIFKNIIIRKIIKVIQTKI